MQVQWLEHHSPLKVKSPSGNLVLMTMSWLEIIRRSNAYACRFTWIPRLSPVPCLLGRLDSLVDLVPRPLDKIECLAGILR